MSAVLSTPGVWMSEAWNRARHTIRPRHLSPERVMEAFQQQHPDRMDWLHGVHVDKASYLYFFNTILFMEASCSILDALLDKAPNHHPQLLEEIWVGVACMESSCPQLIETMAQRCKNWVKKGTLAPSEVLCTSISLKQSHAWSSIVDAYNGHFNHSAALGAALAVDCPQALEWLAERVNQQPDLNVFRMTADVLAGRRSLCDEQFDVWMNLMGPKMAHERQSLLNGNGAIDLVLGSDEERLA